MKVIYFSNKKEFKKKNNIFYHYNLQANFLMSWKLLFENFKSMNYAFIMCDSFNGTPQI